MATPLASTQPRAWPLNILYVDDVAELRDLMRDRLALDGHHVETAGDGEAALALLARNHASFHLIITDHNMPRIDGLDLVWHIRRMPYAGRIIVLSSELSPAVRDRYRRFRVDLLLSKPVFPAAFCQKLRELFSAENRRRAVTHLPPVLAARSA